jgi:hypothetical protein
MRKRYRNYSPTRPSSGTRSGQHHVRSLNTTESLSMVTSDLRFARVRSMSYEASHGSSSLICTSLLPNSYGKKSADRKAVMCYSTSTPTRRCTAQRCSLYHHYDPGLIRLYGSHPSIRSRTFRIESFQTGSMRMSSSIIDTTISRRSRRYGLTRFSLPLPGLKMRMLES